MPYKHPLDNARFAYTAARYNRPFDLDEIAERVGYPLFMKPYDGGQWLGVSRITRRGRAAPRLRRLRREADAPAGGGRRLRRLRPLAVDRPRDDGDEVPARRADARPLRRGARLPDAARSAREVVTISRLVNAFFRWEFNSCECLVRGDEVYPIDYANACPDVAVTSLHYYFPWAMKALREVVRVLRRHRPAPAARPRHAPLLRRRRPRRALLRGEARRLPPAGRRLLRDRALPGVLRHRASPTSTSSCSTGSPSPELRRAAASTPSAGSTPPHEHERFVAHFRGLVGLWVREQGAEPALSG